MMDFTIEHLHAYRIKEELPRLLQFVGECNLLANCCGYVHPGDMGHLLSNGLRGRDLKKHCYIYELADEGILGLVLIYPERFSAYEVLVHPHYRGSELEVGLLVWAEQQTRTLLELSGRNVSWIDSDVMDCDTIWRDLLQQRGYISENGPDFYYTTRSLLEPVPTSMLPEGFVMRSVAGEYEAEAVRLVHASAFASNWRPGEYLNVMRTPGFHIDRELVVVAPDKRFAAFLVYWIDPVSKNGLFEPVGCHRDFQRRGLTRALMYEGMRRMLSHGMSTAIVKHEPPQKNPAAAALYRSLGFTVTYTITSYRKQIGDRAS
jgi:mycothiol synthase